MLLRRLVTIARVRASTALHLSTAARASASSPVLLRHQRFAPRAHLPLCRCLSTSRDDERDAPSIASVGAADAASPEAFTGVPGVESPGEKFVMLYTCAVCETRAAKTISKHAYQKGVVLVRCPGCEKLHLIADHLGWFDDESVDVESILAAKGESVRVVTHENVLELTDRELLGHLRKDE